MKIDTRLVGATAEKVFLSLVNQKGIFATSFDTVALDGIVYDANRQLFKVGQPPSYVQIKVRGSGGDDFNPQGHGPDDVQAMNQMADDLSIPRDCLYFVVGFFKNADIRTLVFFGIPLGEMARFWSGAQFRFSVASCRKEVEEANTIFEI